MLPKALITAFTGLLLLSAAPASAWSTEYGHTGSRDRVLEQGCHNYGYHYVVKAPTDDWLLETFLVDPTGQGLGSGTFISDYDPRRAHRRFRICEYTTRPGRFTIKARLIWYDGDEDHRVRLRPSHFRLRPDS